MRTIHSAEIVYQATAGAGKYGTLVNLSGQNMFDSVLATGTKSGYSFTCTNANLDLTTSSAWPASARART